MEKRLQSIRCPRDLTLGGTKPKKIFTPNLNVARNKEKKDLFLKNEEKRKHNNRKDFVNNHKKFERNERFIQSSGIFSDGVGSDVVRKTRYERAYAFIDDMVNVMPKPRVKKNEWQIDNETEDKTYNDLMSYDDLSDNDEKLPFAPLSWSETDLKEAKVPIKVKPEVKIECDETNSLGFNRLRIKPSDIPTEFLDSQIFSDYNPAIMLWSMPDSFAGKGLSDDPNVTTLFDYKLSEMLEGEIGKIQIRKSGKIEVLIGCVKYDLQPNSLETFTEKIGGIDINDPKGSNATVLGEILSRFVLNPDWKYLLRDS